jgi:hypothetical protein
MDHVHLWKGIAAFARKPDCEWMSFYQPMHDIIRSLASVLDRAVRRNETLVPVAQRVFTNLRTAEEDVLTAMWLRSHIFAYGLFGQKQQGEKPAFLTEEQTKAGASDMSAALHPIQLSGRLIPCRWDLQPVYTMIDTGVWDDACRSQMDEALKDDRAVDGLALMLYGSGFTTDSSTVSSICTLEPFLESAKRRLKTTGSDRPHETVILALQKATSGGW